jgi:hypothetical protein
LPSITRLGSQRGLEVELQPFIDVGLNRDLAVVYEKLGWKPLKLADERYLSFKLEGKRHFSWGKLWLWWLELNSTCAFLLSPTPYISNHFLLPTIPWFKR